MDFDAAFEELGIDKDNFRVLALLPLVYVAWADGKMQGKERATIFKLANEMQWLTESGEALLQKWFDERPSDEYIAKGLKVLNGLGFSSEGPGAEVTADVMQLVVLMCRDVATAAGGYWGLADPIGAAEEEALLEIAKELEIESASSWRKVVLDHGDHTAEDLDV
jgi:hypothetical protein